MTIVAAFATIGEGGVKHGGVLIVVVVAGERADESAGPGGPGSA
ncbi:MAG TPA: hypothetical protein VEF89_23850 [Solirubrobacteraceae bacterium]|nr:hypothetical protein [Solirubrobacteraceae bacterium]